MEQDAQIHILSRPGSHKAATAGVYFTRHELSEILNIYGQRVAMGDWRDYALDMGQALAVFSVFRRTSEAPLYRLIKDPTLRNKQGQWRLLGMDGRILKRGQNLRSILTALKK